MNSLISKSLLLLIRDNSRLHQADWTFSSMWFPIYHRQSTHLILGHLPQNAGIGNPQIPLEDLSLSVFHDVLETNVVAPFLCTRYAFKIFKRQSPQGGWYRFILYLTYRQWLFEGRIINNGSISAQVPRLYSSPYTASKHAIQGLTKSTALDGRAFNITCTQIDIGLWIISCSNNLVVLSTLINVSVGNAHTDMAASHEQGALQPNGKIVSEGTFDVKHVADAVAHIASLPLNVTVLTMNIMWAMTVPCFKCT